MVKSVFKFESATADVFFSLNNLHLVIWRGRVAGLFGNLAKVPDAAGHDEAFCLFTAVA